MESKNRNQSKNIYRDWSWMVPEYYETNQMQHQSYIVITLPYELWYPVISYHVHFIFGVTSYQREKLCSLHPMFTSYLESLHTLSHFIFGVTSYLESLHTWSHFILWVTSYIESLHTWGHSIPESLHTLRHFIPWVTSYPKSLHTWLHFIPRTISYHGPLHTIDHLIPLTTSYHGLLHTFYIVDHFIPYRYCSSHTDHMIWSVQTKGWISNRPLYWKPKKYDLGWKATKILNKTFLKTMVSSKS